MDRLQVYVAASWRTPEQPAVVQALRNGGLTVYDFRNPPNRSGFAWQQISERWQEWTPQEYITALRHPLAEAGFAADIGALRAAYIITPLCSMRINGSELCVRRHAEEPMGYQHEGRTRGSPQTAIRQLLTPHAANH